MEILSINSECEIIIKVKIEELNDFVATSKLHEYDEGFNKGWEMAEKEYTNINNNAHAPK